MQDICLELTWYAKEGDQFIGETVLKEVDLAKLRNLLNLPPDDPISYIHPIKEAHASFLQGFTNIKIDLSEYDYFIERAV
ncbi:colicin E3-like toxin immunity protein [Synechococcus sp. PCC 6312]|uniref:DUF7683 domain-containing protein n=1 Tax=Synechococcus sp. (strain ATCC 27167 / PCC 6312) TaxID=195253 RepID=UPI00029F1BC2|nr:colicin E3-like toxin immunity protein [Synechococcus sp. PCC 6312]AFY61912.1 hypothetical protein Syn6312_2841 [Synechococcus sp. PCC 6312]